MGDHVDAVHVPLVNLECCAIVVIFASLTHVVVDRSHWRKLVCVTDYVLQNICELKLRDLLQIQRDTGTSERILAGNEASNFTDIKIGKMSR